MLKVNLVSKNMSVAGRFCPMCGTPYERIRWQYGFRVHDEDTEEDTSLFFTVSDYECEECGYVHHENECYIRDDDE